MFCACCGSCPIQQLPWSWAGGAVGWREREGRGILSGLWFSCPQGLLQLPGAAQGRRRRVGSDCPIPWRAGFQGWPGNSGAGTAPGAPGCWDGTSRLPACCGEGIFPSGKEVLGQDDSTWRPAWGWGCGTEGKSACSSRKIGNERTEQR